jgi:hypothetical protein
VSIPIERDEETKRAARHGNSQHVELSSSIVHKVGETVITGGWWVILVGWWLVVGDIGWLVVGGWWLVVGGWWLVGGYVLHHARLFVDTVLPLVQFENSYND